jgi:hypothetical protein
MMKSVESFGVGTEASPKRTVFPLSIDGLGRVCANIRSYYFSRLVGRALDRRNVTESLSAASELEHVGLAEALELCLLLREKAPERYPRAALRWHRRLCREVDVSLEEAQAILAALVVMAGERKGNAAYALAELLSSSRSAQRRGR